MNECRIIKLLALATAIAALVSGPASAQDAELAKRCLRAAYMLYPYKRPGAAPMSGDRLFFFKECMARRSNPSPGAPKQPLESKQT